MDLMRKLKPDERIAIYVIARRLGLVLVQDYTTDHALLLRSLSKYVPRGLAPSPLEVDSQDTRNPLPPDSRKATPLEKEFIWKQNSEQARLSLQALAEHLSLVPGRKSVYWITQAFPARLMRDMGQFAWDKTTTALNEANVAVNTVDSRGLMTCGPPVCQPRDAMNGTITAMEQIAEETGGKAYFNRNDLDEAIAEGIAASRMSYTLGFYLADDERDNKFHALKVKTNRPGLELSYRQGYYAGNVDLPDSSRDKGDLESSLLNQVNATAVGILARINPVQGTPRGTLNISLRLDSATLSLKEQPGKWTGKVEETFVEQDASGNMLTKASDIKTFEITSSNRAHYDSQGVSWPFSIPLMPGATKLAIIVRDSATGHVGSLSVPLPPSK